MDQFKKIQSRVFTQTATASKPISNSTPTQPASAGRGDGKPPISRPRPLRRREKLIKVEDICPVTIIDLENQAHQDISTRYRAWFNDDGEDDSVEGLYVQKSLPTVQPLRLQKQKGKNRIAHSRGAEVAGPSQSRSPVRNSPLRHPARTAPRMSTPLAQGSSLSTPNPNLRKRTHVRDPSIRYAQYEPLGTRADRDDVERSAGQSRLHPQAGPSVSMHGRSVAKALGIEPHASRTAAKPNADGTNATFVAHSLPSRPTGSTTNASARNADIMRFARSPHVAAVHLQRFRSDASKALDNLPVAKWGPEGSPECVAFAKTLKKEERERAQVWRANVKIRPK